MAKEGLTKNKHSLRKAARSSTNRLHVVPTKKGWSVKREGAVKSSGTYKTEKEALWGAASLKSKSSIVIHRKDGTIERWSEKA